MPNFASGAFNGIGGISIHNPFCFADDPIKPKGFKAGHLHLTGYEAMAYSSRDANYVINAHGRWRTPAEDERCFAWLRVFSSSSKASLS